ncbi:hypothetical protein D3C77_293740 [compost metagenome]
MDAVEPVMTGGKAGTIGNGLIDAVLVFPFHQDVAGRPIMIKLERLALFQGDSEHVFGIGIGGQRPQVATDDQRCGSGI